MNILIVKTSAIGDVTHTLPALNALRLKFPKAHITWLIEEEAADLITGHPALDRVLISERKRWIRDFKAGKRLQTIRRFCHFLKKIRGTRYDMLIDFQGLLKSSALIAACRAKRKIGFGRGMDHSECSHLFLNERIPPVDMDMHAVERELFLLQSLGIETTGEVICKLPVNETSKKEAEAILAEAGIDRQRPLTAINPMTTWQTKHWYNGSFAELADRLIEHGIEIVFTGGAEDKASVDDILKLMQGKAANLAGKTSLKTLAALYTQAKVVISTDTGPMHIAAAAGTQVLALFGPTAPWRTGPYGAQHKILRTDISCSPCYKKRCEGGGHECMRQITVDMVFEELRAMLNTP